MKIEISFDEADQKAFLEEMCNQIRSMIRDVGPTSLRISIASLVAENISELFGDDFTKVVKSAVNQNLSKLDFKTLSERTMMKTYIDYISQLDLKEREP